MSLRQSAPHHHAGGGPALRRTGTRALVVVGGAGLYALALPPFDYALLGWLAVVPLLLVLRGTSHRASFGYGLLYGCAFGWFVTWWSVQAVQRYFALGWPLCVLGLTFFYVAVFIPTFGLFGVGAARLLRSERVLLSGLAISALWVTMELLRGRLLGHPWCLLGYSQYTYPELIQIAAWTGVYGVSFLLVFVAAGIAQAVALSHAGHRRSALAALAVPLGLTAATWAGGAMVIEAPQTAPHARPIAVVQTGIAPAFEWTRAYSERQLLAHVRATEALHARMQPALVVWPENAVTQYLESDPLLANQIGMLAQRTGADIVFGAPRYQSGRTFNSARLMTAAGRDGGYYDKRHLVLLAEAGVLTRPDPAGKSESPRQFSAGTSPRILSSFARIGLSICHEITYPELVAESVRAGAELLINLSNDGWLDRGHGAASRQHFAMAVFRAVETRRALVRAATTGISGIVDPYGRTLTSLPPGAVGVASAGVSGETVLTPYVEFGDAFALACALFASVALVPTSLRLTRRALAPANSLP